MWIPWILGPLEGIIAAIQVGLPPTLAAIRREPSLLLSPTSLSHLFFGGVWVVFGAGVDAGAAPTKRELITPHASGVILDIGAGYGHALPYIPREHIIRYIAVEPNTSMHAALRATIVKCGLSEEEGSALILPYGAGDIEEIVEALGGPHSIDTIISILTLCSVPNARNVIPKLCETLLRPGGTLLLYEHTLSPLRSSRIVQRLWAPVWAVFFDGCRLDCDTVKWVKQVNWKEKHVWTEAEQDESDLIYHQVGRFII